MTSIPLLILIGFGVGIGLGFTGVGAGSLLTPILVLFAGVHPVTAVGTSLVFSAITKSAGSLQHLRQRTADFRVVRWMAAGSVPSAIASLVLVRTVVKGVLLDAFTQRAITGALVVVAIVLTLRFLNRLPVRTTPPPPAALVALGVLVGVMVALTSVGSGSVAIAFLGLLTPFAAASLIGTDMTHAALLSFVAAPFYVAAGTVNYALALSLAIGSIPGVIIGSRLAARLPERVTRGAVLVVVWVVALRLV